MTKLTSICIIAIFLFVENASAQSWISLKKEDSQEFFYDSASIKGTKYQRKITIKKNIFANGIQGIKSSIFESSINCDYGTLIYESIKTYSQLDLTGNEQIVAQSANSVKIKPNTTGQLIYSKACVENNNFAESKDQSDLRLMRNIPKVEVREISESEVAYFIPLEFYNTVVPNQNAGLCDLRIVVNGKPFQTVQLGMPLKLQIPVNINDVSDANISWENQTPISGGRYNCVGQGDIFLSELRADEWRTLEEEFESKQPQGATCLLQGMNFKKLPYFRATILKEGISYPSVHNSVAKEVVSACRKIISQNIRKNYECRFGAEKRVTKCNDDWYELKSNQYFKVADSRYLIEGILSGKTIEVRSTETPQANADYKAYVAQQEAEKQKRLEEEAQKRAKKAEDEEKRRIWLASSEGQNWIAQQEAQARREEEASQKLAAEENLRIAREFPFYAIISCGIGMGHMTINACFSGNFGSLEVRNGSDYGLYKIVQIVNRMIPNSREEREGLVINLKNSHEITALNGEGKNLILGLKIIQRSSGSVVFQKQVDNFGIITWKKN